MEKAQTSQRRHVSRARTRVGATLLAVGIMLGACGDKVSGQTNEAAAPAPSAASTSASTQPSREATKSTTSSAEATDTLASARHKAVGGVSCTILKVVDQGESANSGDGAYGKRNVSITVQTQLAAPKIEGGLTLQRGLAGGAFEPSGHSYGALYTRTPHNELPVTVPGNTATSFDITEELEPGSTATMSVVTRAMTQEGPESRPTARFLTTGTAQCGGLLALRGEGDAAHWTLLSHTAAAPTIADETCRNPDPAACTL